jgi:uncharacterized repeat protein (TIGR03803 family)
MEGKRFVSIAVIAFSSLMTAAQAQTFTKLFSFDRRDGAGSQAGLIQGTGGNFYGTTSGGGANGPYYGTVFEITPSGTLTRLYSFCSESGCTDGTYPTGALIQATNGYFYGTTQNEGANDGGTVFEIAPGGRLKTLYNFCAQVVNQNCTDGEFPATGLVQATNGDLYGTTVGGGANGFYGTVFKIAPRGTLTTLYSFYSQNASPGPCYASGLIQATNGNFYGTTLECGANDNAVGNGAGTVFEITPSGTLTTLYSFCSQSGCTDGSAPDGALIQATDGNFYGTTRNGGTNDNDTCISGGCGTIFQITLGGTLTTLYDFCSQLNCTDGANPSAALIQATDGNFYGTTSESGANGWGTIFQITPGGTLTTLYSFCSQSGCTDGQLPFAGLVQATNGDFYGTTYNGGTSSNCYDGCGTVFSLSTGLGPFVETQTTAGKVGTAVKILGTDLTGATSVSFNGAAAAFTVVSPSLITTRVPAGASTGTAQVVTPSGTLSSNVPFRVLP